MIYVHVALINGRSVAWDYSEVIEDKARDARMRAEYPTARVLSVACEVPAIAGGHGRTVADADARALLVKRGKLDPCEAPRVRYYQTPSAMWQARCVDCGRVVGRPTPTVPGVAGNVARHRERVH